MKENPLSQAQRLRQEGKDMRALERELARQAIQEAENRADREATRNWWKADLTMPPLKK